MRVIAKQNEIFHSHSGTGAAWNSTSGLDLGSASRSSLSCLVFTLVAALLLLCLSDGLSILLIFVHGPVEDIVVLEAFADEEVTENLAQVRVVWLVVETEGPGVVEVNGELVREAAAKDLGGSGHLLFHDTVILLLLRGSLESLPGKRAAAEVQHDITQRLHIVATRLLNAQVGIDGSITSSSGQVLVFAVRDVEVSFRVTVLLRQSEVDDV